jgi:hypothetical protein
LPDPSLHLPTASPQGGNATERGERLDNPYTGAKTKDNGLGGQAGATDRNVSSPTRDFSFVDALENVLGIDINGDGYKGQGYGLVDGLEAVSRWRGQDLTDPGWGWYLLQVLGCVCRVEAVCAVSRSGNVRKGERRMRMALMRWCNSGQVTGLDIDGDGESGAGLGKILEEVTGMQVIASKDAEIEDLKKRLVATEKQLAEAKRKAEELEADLNKTKVCVRRV